MIRHVRLAVAFLLAGAVPAVSMPAIEAQGAYPPHVHLAQSALTHHDPERRLFANIQRMLNDLGYDAGPVDGVFGDRTAQAIVAFQRDNGIPDREGSFDNVTVEALTAAWAQRSGAAPEEVAADMARPPAEDPGAPLPPDVAERYEMFGYVPERTRNIFELVQEAFAERDAGRLALAAGFPLRINHPGGPTMIENAAELAAVADSIFTDEIAQAVANQNFAGLFLNDQGAMIGNGELWIQPLEANNACFGAPMVLGAINLDADPGRVPIAEGAETLRVLGRDVTVDPAEMRVDTVVTSWLDVKPYLPADIAEGPAEPLGDAALDARLHELVMERMRAAEAAAEAYYPAELARIDPCDRQAGREFVESHAFEYLLVGKGASLSPDLQRAVYEYQALLRLQEMVRIALGLPD